MTSIAIEWDFGRPATGAEADEARAAAAAEAVLDAAGVDYHETEAEYLRQWAAVDDEELMTGLARVWIDARNAADRALTEGWHDPTGAACTITATA